MKLTVIPHTWPIETKRQHAAHACGGPGSALQWDTLQHTKHTRTASNMRARDRIIMMRVGRGVNASAGSGIVPWCPCPFTQSRRTALVGECIEPQDRSYNEWEVWGMLMAALLGPKCQRGVLHLLPSSRDAGSISATAHTQTHIARTYKHHALGGSTSARRHLLAKPKQAHTGPQANPPIGLSTSLVRLAQFSPSSRKIVRSRSQGGVCKS